MFLSAMALHFEVPGLSKADSM